MTRVLLKNSDSLTMDQGMISETYYQYFDGCMTDQLQQYDFEYGLCTMCIGMGQGIAMLLKRT
jgi:acetyl-CoA acetyltransferase